MDVKSEFEAVLQLLSVLIFDPRNGTLIGLLFVAAWSDCRSGRIPNVLVLCGMFLGLTYNTLVPPIPATPLASFGSALAGMACGLVLMLPFYLLRAMGAGDVKLMAMCGAFLGYPETAWAVLATLVAGGALSLAYAAWHGVLRRTVRNVFVMLRSLALGIAAGMKPTLLADKKTSVGTVPYGIAIASGTIGYLVLHQLGLVN